MTDQTKGDVMTLEQLVSDLEHQRGAPLTCDEFQIAEIVWQAAQSAMRVDEAGDVEDMVSKALRRAWQLGQTYWQQADSDSWSQNKKADETQAKFATLVDEMRAALQAALAKE